MSLFDADGYSTESDEDRAADEARAEAADEVDGTGTADVGALDFVKGRVAFAYTFEPNYFTYGLSGDLDLHAGGVFGSRWGGGATGSILLFDPVVESSSGLKP